MRKPAQWSDDNLLSMAAIIGKNSVRTQYACQVVAVSDDGRFVDLVHNTLEWETCTDGDTIMINEFGKDVLCSPTKPWVVTDIPVEETYERGQWKVRSRPRVGDKGILSVFYHDISTLKEKGGFQAPGAIRVMAIDSASWRPGLPNHADVNASPEYPTDDEWELNGNGVKIKLTSPVDTDSESPNKMEVTVGDISFTIEAPQNGTPTITLNASGATVNVNAGTANITASDSVTIDTPTTTITGSLNVGSTITATGEIVGQEVTAGGIPLSQHIHTGGTITDPITGQQVTGTPITIPV